MTIKTWKERIVTPTVKLPHLFEVMQDEIDELRAELEKIKQLAKQAGSSSCEADYFMSFSPAEIDKFVRLVRESVLSEARQAIEMANADRHIYVPDCVQIIEDLK